MEVGGIVKLKWPMNHNTYIGVVHKINKPSLSFREPCIIICGSRNITPVHKVIKINKICCGKK